MKIGVVVDSTAVVGKTLIEQYDNLYSVPLKIIFGDETYADGIDLTQDEFFNMLDGEKELPTTSQPSIGEVESVFTELLETYDHIIYITLSSGISGTFDSGQMARSIVSEEKITVFDTMNASIIHRLIAIEALEMIERGKSLKEILDRLDLLRSHARIVLVVDDLKHLSRTGRLSATSAQIGNMLKIKPILHFHEGKIELLKKIRSAKKAHKAIVEMAKEVDLRDGDYIQIAQAHGMEYAQNLQKELKKVYPNMNIVISDLSPVISVHTGPKTIGIGWIKL